MSGESETPRCDRHGELATFDGYTQEMVVDINFARELERELNEAREERDTAESNHQWWEKNARQWKAVAERMAMCIRSYKTEWMNEVERTVIADFEKLKEGK